MKRVSRRDRRAVHALLDGELSPAAAEALRERAARRPALAAYLARMERLQSTLSTPTRPSPAAPALVPPTERVARGRWIAWPALAAAALTLLWFTPSDERASRQLRVPVALSAPGARSVAVTGDFDGWSRGALQLHDSDGDGVWEGVLVLPPGRYAYQFVVDGAWRLPPDAASYRPDGFGGRNGVLEI